MVTLGPQKRGAKRRNATLARKRAGPCRGQPDEACDRFEHRRLKDRRSTRLRIRIAAEAGDRVIAFAYRQEQPEARHAVLTELKEMLTRYLLP